MASMKIGLTTLAILAATGCGRYTFQPVEDKDTAIKQLEYSLGLEGKTLGEWTDKTFSDATNKRSVKDYTLTDGDIEIAGKAIYGPTFDSNKTPLGRIHALNNQLDNFADQFKAHVLGLAGKNTSSAALDGYNTEPVAERGITRLMDQLPAFTKDERKQLAESGATLDTDLKRITLEVTAYNTRALTEVGQLSQTAAWISFLEGDLVKVNVYNRLTATVAKTLSGTDIYAEGQEAVAKIWATTQQKQEYQTKLDAVKAEASFSMGPAESIDNACQGPVFDLLRTAQIAQTDGIISRKELTGAVYQILHDATAVWLGQNPVGFDVTELPQGTSTYKGFTPEALLDLLPFSFFRQFPRLFVSEQFAPQSKQSITALNEALSEGGIQMNGYANSSYLKGPESEVETAWFANLAATFFLYPSLGLY